MISNRIVSERSSSRPYLDQPMGAVVLSIDEKNPGPGPGSGPDSAAVADVCVLVNEP